MFDFRNLDDVDGNAAPQEWQRWQEVPELKVAPRHEPAVLEHAREEHFAANDEDQYVYEKLDIPNLPEEDNFDPVGLLDDTMDAIEDRMASYNGQVILNYVAGAFEEYLMIEREKDERKAYIESLHQDRLAILEVTKKKAHESYDKSAGAVQRNFDRKKFAWRDVSTPLTANIIPLGDGGAFCEAQINSSMAIMKALSNVAGHCVMPTAALVQIIATIGHQVRPMPSQRLGRNAEWQLAITDVFFPSCFVLDDGSEVFKNIFEGKGGPPTLVHLVAMSINKEAGGLEAKSLLETIKLNTEMNRPRRRNTGMRI